MNTCPPVRFAEQTAICRKTRLMPAWCYKDTKLHRLHETALTATQSTWDDVYSYTLHGTMWRATQSTWEYVYSYTVYTTPCVQLNIPHEAMCTGNVGC